jgi:hypothetical protein
MMRRSSHKVSRATPCAKLVPGTENSGNWINYDATIELTRPMSLCVYFAGEHADAADLNVATPFRVDAPPRKSSKTGWMI